jgi:hypothetical protein
VCIIHSCDVIDNINFSGLIFLIKFSNGDVSVAEEDWEDPTTELNVVDNITGVDDTQDVYKQWDKVVPEVGDVKNHIDDDVQVVLKLAMVGVTAKWDQPLQVSPTVATAKAEVNVSSKDTG